MAHTTDQPIPFFFLKKDQLVFLRTFGRTAEPNMRLNGINHQNLLYSLPGLRNGRCGPRVNSRGVSPALALITPVLHQATIK